MTKLLKNFMLKKYKINNDMRKQIEIDKFKNIILTILNKKYPNYYIELEHVSDSGDYCLGIAIYNVPEKMLDKVTNYVLDLDWKLCAKKESNKNKSKFDRFSLVPLIHSEEITKKYYPEIIQRRKSCEH